MYHLIYQALKVYLSANVPALKDIQMYKGKKPGKGHFLCTPVLQVRFLPTEWRDLGEGLQEGEIEFEVLLYSDNVSEDDDKLITDEDGLTHMELANQVYVAISENSFQLSQVPGNEDLAGTKDDLTTINTIRRTNTDQDSELAWYMLTTQRFEGYAKDFTASRRYQRIMARITPDVSVTIAD